MHNRTRSVAVASIVAAAAIPATAQAHVTLQPTEVPAGGFTRLDVRVPDERDDANTTKVAVQFPPGFVSVSYEPVEGWSARVKMVKLDKPVEAFGEEHTEGVDTITFSSKGEGIRPGQFQDFGLSLAMPDAPDSSLTFKAVQTYSNGEVVRWIGAPDADQPAPQVKLTAAAEPAAPDEAAQASAPTREPGADDGDGGAKTLAIVALAVGALGLLAGGAALAAWRRVRSGA